MSPEERPTSGTCLCTAHYCHCVVLAQRLAEMEAERDRLAAVLAEPEKATNEWVKGKGGTIEMQHWAVKVLAASLRASLGESQNFIAMDVIAPDETALVVTIQRKWGKSPVALMAEVRAERDRLLGMLSDLVASPAEHDDIRVGYVLLQVDREAIRAAQAAIARKKEERTT